MTETIPVPVWLALLAASFVSWAVLDRFVIPATRWLVRRRVSGAVDELNTKLQFRMPAFKLTRRESLIDRLVADPRVMEAVDSYAEESDMSRTAIRGAVERYAREIVPSFNPYAYFRIGNYLARRTAQLLYRVRLGYSDEHALARIGPNSSVVFVMNHRSNMDYLIVAFMAAHRTALSYAVGEWARIWPLQTLIRSLGAYFVRRKSRNRLYRRVLARYVQMATQSGVVQAMYPEGGLSRDGSLQPLKLGLLSYMVTAFDPSGERDLVFVPVGISYDRVLEDRSLIRELDPTSPERSKAFVIATFLKLVARNLRLMLGRKWFSFGYACVSFGTPISMRSYTQRDDIDFRASGTKTHRDAVQALGNHLLEAIGATIPVVPVSLVATVFVRHPKRAMSGLEIKALVQQLIDRLESGGAYVHIPRADRDYALEVGLRMLALRHLVIESDGLFRAAREELTLLRYYANGIAHFLDEGR